MSPAPTLSDFKVFFSLDFWYGVKWTLRNVGTYKPGPEAPTELRVPLSEEPLYTSWAALVSLQAHVENGTQASWLQRERTQFAYLLEELKTGKLEQSRN